MALHREPRLRSSFTVLDFPHARMKKDGMGLSTDGEKRADPVQRLMLRLDGRYHQPGLGIAGNMKEVFAQQMIPQPIPRNGFMRRNVRDSD